MAICIKRGDFPNICRTCLLFKENMSSIFAPEVLNIIHLCTEIKINSNDELPNLICLECTNQVQKSFSFRQLCKDSEEILQRIVHDDVLDSRHNLNEIKTEDLQKSADETVIKAEDSVEDYHEHGQDYFNETNLYEQDSSVESCKEESEDKTDFDMEKIKKLSNCQLCGKKMLERALVAHMRRHKKIKKHKCDQCPKAYREPCELAKHRSNLHNAKSTLQCEVCNKVFQIQAQLDFHLKSHFKRTYSCDVCQKEFFKSNKLKRHKETHDKREKSFFCLYCDSTFMREASLKLHNKKYHSDQPYEKRICNICGKAVFNIRTHFLHKHITEKPHKCNLCNRAFPFKSTLSKHINEKHLGIHQEFKALCSICGKCCASQGDLKKHLRTHVEDRQYDCHLCEKKYKSVDGLRAHLKVHANLRPHVCTYCPKAFHTRTILNNHLRTHTGERPFACHICGRAFAQKVALTTHMKVHDL